MQSGWTALSDMISGYELVWKVEDNGVYLPDMYPSENDVWKSYADDLMEQLRQFQNDEREFDEVDWEPQIHIARIVIYTDGEMMVYDGSEDAPQPILLTTLQKWREQL